MNFTMSGNRIFDISTHSNSSTFVKNISHTSKSKCDLEESIRPLIAFGRLAAIIPCGWSNWHLYKKPKLSLIIVPVLLTTFFALWSFTEMILNVNLVLKRAKKKQGFMAYIVGANQYFALRCFMTTFMYVHFIRNSDMLYRLVERWKIVSSQALLEPDKGLRIMGFLSLLFIFPSICVAVLFLVNIMSQFSPNANSSKLQSYYRNVVWNSFVPYHPFFAILYIVVGMFYTLLPRIYAQALVIFFSRALSFQFKKLIESATNARISTIYFVDLKNKDEIFWKDIAIKHETLCLLVKAVNEFLSPIIFGTTALSLYNISTMLFKSLSTGNSKLSSYVFTISFAVEVAQYFIMIVCATNVNTYAIKILDILRKCPKEYYHESGVSRLDVQVSSGQTVAFSGLGWYFITKRFLPKIISAIFTIEIVLLQADEPATIKK